MRRPANAPPHHSLITPPTRHRATPSPHDRSMVVTLSVICYAGFTIPWLFFLVYMAAMGDITTSTGSFNAGAMTIDYAYKEFSYDKQQQDLAWFYLFGYFWTSEFIVALGQVTSKF